jgi:transcription elongation factor Elf1
MSKKQEQVNVLVLCPSCNHPKLVSHSETGNTQGNLLKLDFILAGLRCQSCGMSRQAALEKYVTDYKEYVGAGTAS